MPRRSIPLAVGVASLLAIACSSSAVAAPAPWWQLSSFARPTYVQPGSEAEIVVDAVNMGDAAVSGAPVIVTDTLPAGMTAAAVSGSAGAGAGGLSTDGPVECVVSSPSVANCSWTGPPQLAPGELPNPELHPLAPYEQIEMTITVKVAADARSGTNEASVSGGEVDHCKRVEGTGAYKSEICAARNYQQFSETHTGEYESEVSGAIPGLSATRQVLVGEGATPFGVSEYGLALENQGGSADTQAGSHPFQFTTTLGLNQSSTTAPFQPALPKDFHVDLPPGLVGNATAVPQCDEADFAHILSGNSDLCEADTAVGVASVTIVYRGVGSVGPGTLATFSVPIFNLVPSPGEPARFGFVAEKSPVLIDTAVRTGKDYGIVATVSNTTEFVAFESSRVTLWGVPGDPRHDASRGWSCVTGGFYGEGLPPCESLKSARTPPLLSSPTSCTGELQTAIQADAWNGAQSAPPLYQVPMPGLEGCDRLPFAASLSVAPDVQEASKPTGLNVHVHVPQEASVDPTGLADADVKDTTVTLPEGIALNPAGADGLQACTDGEIGYEPANTELTGELGFTETLPEPLEPGLELGARGFCPNASKIGTVKIKTPLLEHELEGSVYLASQNANPFGSLVAIYIVAEEHRSGVLVKLPGEVSLNSSTGQITTTFLNTPQVPFEDLELHFFGGERAPLSTPALCRRLDEPGYQTVASFTPWSGNSAVTSTSEFHILTGPGGGACPNPPGNQSLSTLPFAPFLTAGTTSNQAGGFSPLTTTITREDGQQNIQAVQLHMPAGLSGVLSGVKLCGEAQANAGTCGAESLIGSTIVSVGLGGDPYSVTGGQVFLTEKVAGSPSDAPFGLSIVNPAVAGPFNLGKVIVRATIAVDPHTAALTITTDGSGSYAIPYILDGIPLQIKHINVTIERKGFTFNPTDCNSLTVTGTVSSVEGAGSPVSDPFQATNCASLKFAPKFAASVASKSSKPDGASLSVKLTYPTGAMGTQANIAKVKVDLPKQLPSRLTTLQKACVAKVFEANPAGCPKESIVGKAKAITPILPVPLEGPAYFVSHGGEAFPSLIVVLQGYGVTVDLVGTTFISKAGITSSTFKTVPDVPVGSFELTLPTGKFSALAANLPAKDKHSFCGQKLAMPTAFVAQNGTEIHESTPLAVSGCAKHKQAKKKVKAKRKRKK